MATAVLSTPSSMGSGPAATTTRPVSTASGLLAMLSEPSPQLVSAALTKLLTIVDTHWHEVAEALPDLEAIAEGAEGDTDRQTAAAIASRVYFHLEEPVQSLRLALDAGVTHFNPAAEGSRGDPYVECLVGAAVEAYVKKSRTAFDSNGEEKGAEGDDEAEDESSLLDPTKLSALVDLMFERCYADAQYGHALGVALEARSLDKVAECLTKSGQSDDGGIDADTLGVQLSTLRYALDAAVGLISDNRPFRDKVIGIVSKHLAAIVSVSATGSALHSAAAVALCVAYQLLNKAEEVGKLLTTLLVGEEGETLVGLQLCFDMVDSGDEAFVGAVADALPAKKAAADGTAEGEGNAEGETEVKDDLSPEAHAALTAARKILTGGFVTELSLSFLHKNSNSDPLIMDHLKKALEERGNARNSVLHNWGVGTHAVLNAGTTNDSFLRDNLDWMKKAGNW